jgi:hypothetical protein
VRWPAIHAATLLVAGCTEVIRVEAPQLDDRAKSVISVITTERSVALHASAAERIEAGEGVLERLPPDTISAALLPYPCALSELGLEDGSLSTAEDPAAVERLPEPIDPRVLSLSDPFAWVPAIDAVPAERIDLSFLRCPELAIPAPFEIATTSTLTGFFAAAVDGGWIAGTEDGRYYEIGAGAPELLGPGPSAIGGDARWIYTAGGELVRRGPSGFEVAATGGPRGKKAYLTEGPSGDVFVVVNDPITDRSRFAKRSGSGSSLETLADWRLGFPISPFLTLIGGVVEDAGEILALDASDNDVVVYGASGIERESLPELGSAPTALAYVEGFGALVGNEFGTILARDRGWAALPEREAGFLVSQIVPIDDGIGVFGQSSIDHYQVDLGRCGFATGVFAPVYLAVPMGDDVLLVAQSEGSTSLLTYVLRRANPIPECLR